jgi:hypothetical protein
MSALGQKRTLHISLTGVTWVEDRPLGQGHISKFGLGIWAGVNRLHCDHRRDLAWKTVKKAAPLALNKLRQVIHLNKAGLVHCGRKSESRVALPRT